MKKINIRVYKESDFDVWNNFVSKAKNSTFLFDRNFMEYHKDRFQDFSLMVYDDSELIAILPANIKDDAVYSHQGLTYGGILITRQLRMTVFFEVFSEILKFLNNNGITSFHWKEIPYFYNSFPSDEWKYLTFITEAELYRRDLCSVIDLQKDCNFSTLVKRKIKKAEKLSIYYKETELFDEFWNNILEPELLKNHQTSPVHTKDEIKQLKSKFEKNIYLYGVFLEEKLVGGVILFIKRRTVHCQYISIMSEYKKTGALDFLHYKLITEEFRDYDYFDFGISNEQNGRKVNKGLLFWKEGFGARGVAQDFYKVPTKNYLLIEEMYL